MPVVHPVMCSHHVLHCSVLCCPRGPTQSRAHVTVTYSSSGLVVEHFRIVVIVTARSVVDGLMLLRVPRLENTMSMLTDAGGIDALARRQGELGEGQWCCRRRPSVAVANGDASKNLACFLLGAMLFFSSELL